MRRRTGFTIVELLVAMALILFIMAILSEAFAAGFKAFRDLKALGEMNERLRTATNTLRKYLAADHFEGRKRLSDPNFWREGPPREGFFRIEQDGPSTPEGTSNTLVSSFRATNHRLHFTAKLRGNARGEFFPASVAGVTNSPALTALLPQVEGYRDVTAAYHAQWVEVQVFLRPTEIAISETGTTAGQLYALHVRARALLPDVANTQDVVVGRTDLAALSDFGLFDHTATNTLYANTAADVTIPARRTQSFRTLGEDDPTRAGADVVLTDVLSMNVRLLVERPTDLAANDLRLNEFVDLSELDFRWPQQGAAAPAVFDTWTQNSQLSLNLPDYGNPVSSQYWAATTYNGFQPPRYLSTTGVPIRIKAIQINLRIWDLKTEQTRQVTLVQDL